MEFRSYNASLINDDNLVGVPLPDATRTKLEDLSSPESIWDAEVVFIDEISRPARNSRTSFSRSSTTGASRGIRSRVPE